MSSTLLAVSSATETVHVFRLARPGNINTNQNSSSSNGTRQGNNNNNNRSASISSDNDSNKSLNDNNNLEDNNNNTNDNSGDILPQLSNDYSDPATTANSASLDALAESKRKPGSVASLLRRGSRTIGRSVAGAMGNYLPTAVTEMWEPQRDFAFLKLPTSGSLMSSSSNNNNNNNRQNQQQDQSSSSSNNSSNITRTKTGGPITGGGGGGGIKSVVAFNAASTRVFVVTAEGYFYQYAIDHAKGGECELLQQYSLLDNTEDY